MNKYISLAIKEAEKGIRNGHGGPFGAIIVKDGKIVGRGHNKVILRNDPTMHSEMVAIHSACKKLKTFDLTGCEIYITAEPCPMCLAAIMWANIEKVYYGCTQKDSEDIGFRDKKFYDVFAKGERDFVKCIDRDECQKVFKEYANIKNKTAY